MAIIREQASEVIINNTPWTVQGETINIISGFGEVNVESHLGEVVHGLDSTTEIGCVKFEIANTDTLFESFKGWKDAIGENVIRINAKSGKIYTLNGASIINDPDIPFSSDTNISIEAKGDPVLI